MKKNLFLADSQATEAFGRKAAANFRAGDIVKITGSLGAGKTTLVRGFVEGLGGVPSQVHSPTFSLVHEYQIPTGSVIHCDFYRLPEGSEMEEFGGPEFFDEDKIIFVEWPERIRLLNLPTRRSLFSVHLRDDASGRIVEFPANWEIVD
jgi:tRNA threonylcarbamoyladenosine biosynthesis protein TsaE